MKRSAGLALLVPILLLGACARVDSVAGARPIVPPLRSAAVGSEKTYTSPDGRLSFRYPAAWFVENHWSEGVDATSFLTSFKLGARCCDMLAGDLKMDFGRGELGADTFESLLRRECADGVNHRVVSCTTESINGLRWGLASARDDSEGSFVDLSVFAVSGSTVYRAVAYVPEGPQQRSGVAQIERIIRSFRVR